jgi:hypothetical protein
MEYKRETIGAVWDEAHELMADHAVEVGILGSRRWSPRLEQYRRLEDAGILRLHTMRKDGLLVGYSAFHVLLHHHYDVLAATQDAVYVAPQHRGFAAAKFMAWVDGTLRAEGVEVVFRVSTEKCDYSRSLERMGYGLHERHYLKEL